LGQGIALGLAEAGADVVVLDHETPTETLAQIETLGRRSASVVRDLSGVRAADAAATLEEAIHALGRLDILVNNAGIIRRAPCLEFSEADWQSVIDLNLSAVFYLSQAAARHFVASGQGGKILLMASMLSFQGGRLVPSYAAAKSGIAGLTRSLAAEWASHGINVNALAPGYMATEFTQALREDPQRAQAILSRIPAGRWGTPDDLKGAAVFLASPASNYIHGAILPVDGGWLTT
jgi:2-deoxy-D-gluconate 3-dehydrogenase